MTKEKKKKGKAAKKAMKFEERKEKAVRWVAEYDGTAYNGDIIKAYRKKFAVNRMKAVNELQLLGVTLTKEQIEKEKRAVKAYNDQQKTRKMKKRLKKKEEKLLKEQMCSPFNEDQSDIFFYIAGYTSGGAPYGVTREEMGLDPWEDLEP